jgi:3-hydroxyisobutyrate dehydrogenase-like beta-hydroxyacid dehydrogenase
MGSALARALLAAGHRVSVWNRALDKCDALRSRGATVAASPISAVEAAETIIVCVRDFEASDALLKSKAVSSALAGKALIQLSTGTPNEARALAEWATERSVRYLGGAILSYPRGIGAETCTILYAGPATLFEAVRPLLLSLGGNPTYLGEDAGAASVLDASALTFQYATLLGFLHGAAICQAEGWPLEAYVSAATVGLSSLGEAMKTCGEQFGSGNYSSEGLASLHTEAAALAHVVKTSEECGVDASLPRNLLTIFERGIEAGYGDDYLARLLKIYRD